MTDEEPWTLVPDVDSRVLDPSSLRGIAHPLRVRLLGLLRSEGPSTATRLAARLGMSSGLTSYHLRQLAAHGFVTEDAGRGVGRERWWRAAHRGTWLDTARLGPQDREAGEAYLRAVAAIAAEQMQRAAEEMPSHPPKWRGDAETLSDFSLRLTAEEATSMLEEMARVIARYRRDDPEHPEEAPSDAVPYVLQVQAFARPGTLRTSEDALDDVPGDGPEGAE